MDKTGKGVAYVSAEDCIMVGIGGLSGVGVLGVPPPSSLEPFLQRDTKLGRRWLFPNEIRPMSLRTPVCSGVSGLSSSADSSLAGPKDRRGGMKREVEWKLGDRSQLKLTALRLNRTSVEMFDRKPLASKVNKTT